MADGDDSTEGIVHPVDSPVIQQNPATVRPGMVAPLFPVVNPTDPLYPPNLATRSMATQEVIDAANSIRRKTRNLAREPSWPPILYKLQALEIEYQKLTEQAKSHYEKTLYYYELIQTLPMNTLDNIKALMEIEVALENSKQIWDSVAFTLSSVVACIHPKE